RPGVESGGLHVAGDQILVGVRPGVCLRSIAAGHEVENPDQVDDVWEWTGDGTVVGDGNVLINVVHDVGHDVVVLPADEHVAAEGEDGVDQVFLAAPYAEGDVELRRTPRVIQPRRKWSHGF